MNPLSFNPLALLGAGVVALTIGFGGGWMINGWRLDGPHQRELAVKQGEYDQLYSKVIEQNRAVDKLAAATTAADDRRKLAELYAGDVLKRIGTRSQAVAASTATDCNGVLKDAWGGWR